MTMKSLDSQGRWRNKVVAVRVSPEEDQLIEAKVRMSGLTKQDYIIRRLLKKDVVVNGNPKVYKALKNQMNEILEELQRIAQGEDVSQDLLEIIEVMTATMRDMKESSHPAR